MADPSSPAPGGTEAVDDRPGGLPASLGGRQGPVAHGRDLRSRLTLAMMRANARVMAPHLPPGPQVIPDPGSALVALEAAAPVVRSDWDALRREVDELPTVDWIIRQPPGWDGTWESYGILGPAGWSAHARRSVPRTVALLEAIPGLETASFSVLAPGTFLRPHRGQNTGVMRGLLGVAVPEPERCGMLIEHGRLDLVEGAMVCFDDTFEHAAWNYGTQERVALMLEVRWPASVLASRFNGLSQRVYRYHPMVGEAFDRAERFVDGSADRT